MPSSLPLSQFYDKSHTRQYEQCLTISFVPDILFAQCAYRPSVLPPPKVIGRRGFVSRSGRRSEGGMMTCRSAHTPTTRHHQPSPSQSSQSSQAARKAQSAASSMRLHVTSACSGLVSSSR